MERCVVCCEGVRVVMSERGKVKGWEVKCGICEV